MLPISTVRPPIQRGCLYPLRVVAETWGVGEKTLRAWFRAHLVQPTIVCREVILSGDSILDAVERAAGEWPDRRPAKLRRSA